MTPECRRVDERLLDLVYEEMDAQERAELQAHVDGCDRCASEIDSLVGMRAALRSLPDEDPPAAVTARLMHQAAAPRTWGQKVMGLFVLHPAWSLGAAAAVVLMISVTLYRYSEEARSPTSLLHEEIVPEPEKEGVAAPAEPATRELAAPEAPAAPAPAEDKAAPPPAPKKAARPRPKERVSSKPEARQRMVRKKSPRSAKSKSSGAYMKGMGDDVDALLGGSAAGAPAPSAPAQEEAQPFRLEGAPSPSAADLEKKGDRLRKKGDWSGAIKAYERALAIDPKYPRRTAIQRAIASCVKAQRLEREATTAPAAMPAD